MMEGVRLERLSVLSGIVSMALLVVAALLFNQWEFLPSAETLTEDLTDNDVVIGVASYVGIVAAFFLIWFAGSMYRILRPKEDRPGWLSVLAFGGGLTAGFGLAIGFSFIAIAAARAGSGEGIMPGEAIALYDLSAQILGQASSVGMAVLLMATAIISLRSALMPAWAAWLTVLIAIGLLTPIAWIVLFAMLVWVAVVSAWFYLREPAVA